MRIGGDVDVMERLNADLFLQDRCLLNGYDVNIRLVRSKNAFALIAAGNDPGFQIELVEVASHVRKAKLAHINVLAKGTAKPDASRRLKSVLDTARDHV